MSEGWQTKPLGELVENLDGKRIPVKEADRKSGPYPYYGASGIVDYVDGFLFEGLHLLVAEDGEKRVSDLLCMTDLFHASRKGSMYDDLQGNS